MDEKEVQHILIEILYAAVNEVENNESIKEKITPDMLLPVYRLAKRHDLAHVVSNFVYKNKIEIDQELLARLQREEIMSVYRNEQMKYSFGEICGAFDEIGIAYIPLKGSVIRPYYPYESMRTSCDIDILIHENDLETAINSLENKGYRCGDRNYHDVSLYSPSKIHLELHFNIQENMDNLDAVLRNAWEYAVPTNSSQYAFSKEFFAFHIFAHMAYHFISGGCGIRPLMDIWVAEHKMGITYTEAKDLLETAGIYKFAVEMSKLSEICFSDRPKDNYTDALLSYVFEGGVYGTSKNKIAVKKEKTKSTFGYSMQRLFMPYRKMIEIFPILKKLPFLLPFCWIIRIFKMIFGGKMRTSITEIKTATSVSNNEIENIRLMKEKLGL